MFRIHARWHLFGVGGFSVFELGAGRVGVGA